VIRGSAPSRSGAQDSDNVAELRRELARMERLLEQVSDFNTLENGKWKSVHTQVNARLFLATQIAQLQDQARERGVDLAAELPPDLPQIRTDERLLGRALRELVANAVRFTRPGSRVTVRGSVSPGADSQPPFLCVAVKDAGNGISREDRERIFLPFEQGGNQPRFRSDDSGLGLGLTLAQRYAALLGGCIEVESEVGIGSTFTICVPLHAGAAGV
jgi:signal transduction histidine kinase